MLVQLPVSRRPKTVYVPHVLDDDELNGTTITLGSELYEALQLNEQASTPSAAADIAADIQVRAGVRVQVNTPPFIHECAH